MTIQKVKDKSQLNVYVPVPLLTEARRVSRKVGVSLSHIASTAIERELERYYELEIMVGSQSRV